MKIPPPLKTWQFYKAYRKILGDTTLQKIFNRGVRQLQRWSADPDYVADSEKNPLDAHRIVLERLTEIGRDDIARGTVSFLADVIGCEVVCRESCSPDKNTVEAECLDDYPPLTAFHEAISRGASADELRHYWQEAKLEIDETYRMAVRS